MELVWVTPISLEPAQLELVSLSSYNAQNGGFATGQGNGAAFGGLFGQGATGTGNGFGFGKLTTDSDLYLY